MPHRPGTCRRISSPATPGSSSDSSPLDRIEIPLNRAQFRHFTRKTHGVSPQAPRCLATIGSCHGPHSELQVALRWPRAALANGSYSATDFCSEQVRHYQHCFPHRPMQGNTVPQIPFVRWKPKTISRRLALTRRALALPSGKHYLHSLGNLHPAPCGCAPSRFFGRRDRLKTCYQSQGKAARGPNRVPGKEPSEINHLQDIREVLPIDL